MFHLEQMLRERMVDEQAIGALNGLHARLLEIDQLDDTHDRATGLRSLRLPIAALPIWGIDPLPFRAVAPELFDTSQPERLHQLLHDDTINKRMLHDLLHVCNQCTCRSTISGKCRSLSFVTSTGLSETN